MRANGKIQGRHVRLSGRFTANIFLPPPKTSRPGRIHALLVRVFVASRRSSEKRTSPLFLAARDSATRLSLSPLLPSPQLLSLWPNIYPHAAAARRLRYRAKHNRMPCPRRADSAADPLFIHGDARRERGRKCVPLSPPRNSPPESFISRCNLISARCRSLIRIRILIWIYGENPKRASARVTRTERPFTSPFHASGPVLLNRNSPPNYKSIVDPSTIALHYLSTCRTMNAG